MAVKKCPYGFRKGKAHNWVIFQERVYCNSCHEFNDDLRPCEAHTMTRWYNACPNIGHVEIGFMWNGRAGPDEVHYFCGFHDRKAQERSSERTRQADARYKAHWGAIEARQAAAVEPYKELLRWADANRELVDADEWLATIVHAARKLLTV